MNVERYFPNVLIHVSLSWRDLWRLMLDGYLKSDSKDAITVSLRLGD